MVPGRVVVLRIAISAVITSIYLSEYFIRSKVRSFERPDIQLETCTPETISATSYQEILWPRVSNVTAAVETVRKHGVAFMEDLLSENQAKKLRDYILIENENTDRSKEFVLDQENRVHLTFGLDENPIIYESIYSILTSQPLGGVVEELLGSDAALMELAAITAYPGANGQHWHKDVSNAEQIVDLYSLFIPLQATTREMGATAMCAGTHICAFEDDKEEEACDAWDDRTLYADTSKPGTGAFMNSLLYHRGSANTSPNGQVRVMFYLSWAESPVHGAFENRVPLGKFALRADQWGRTFSQVIDRSYSILSPINFWSKNRGWNFFEIACVKLASGFDVYGIAIDDIFAASIHLWTVAVVFLLLYACIVEIDYKSRARNQQEKHKLQ